ncbi:MAG: hypothetical protein ACD_15C00027G0003 [uncultured bacterium]|nr:MAG: hypothetical protein ACD_15C00027G0003 [uncultured bacterium]HCU70290.1 hypothetical protein [Candidatus Moranbacteria bacterium]
MDNVQTTQSPVDEQELDNQLGELLKEAEKINQEIKESGIKTDERLSEIESQVDESVAKIEKIHAELNQVEMEVGEELDALILKQVEDVVEESEVESDEQKN